MSNRIYVGNIPYNTTEQELHAAFAEFGEVREVKIITDRETGRPRGFAFVEMESGSVADEAVNALNDSELGGRRMSVSIARERERSSRDRRN